MAEKRNRGRPKYPKPVISIWVHLRLHPDEDDDLLNFFSQIPMRQRASAIKIALRIGGIPSSQKAADTQDDLSESTDNFFM